VTIHLGGRDEEQIRVKKSESEGYDDKRYDDEGTCAMCASPATGHPIEKRENLSKSGLDITRVFVLTWGGASQVFKQRTYRVNRVSDDA